MDHRVRRWDKLRDLPVNRRAEKLLRSLGWELQTEFEHLSEAILLSPAYLDSILSIMEMKAGVREDEEKREAFRGVMHDASRKRGESLAQFATRRARCGASGGPPGARASTPGPGRGRFRGSRPRLSREQMKRVSRCRLCDQKGHWAEDCPNARPPTGARGGAPPKPSGGAAHFAKTDGFCYLGSTSGQGNMYECRAAMWCLLSRRRRR